MKIKLLNQNLTPDKKYIFIVLLIISRFSMAQQMNMNNMDVSKKKNIFLSMMDIMMIKMDHAPSGETVGTQFMLQMIPHHEGALEMAQYEIKHGKDFTMIQLAKSIVAEQRNEIIKMQLWLKNELIDTTKITKGFTGSFSETMTVMMQHMPEKSKLTDNDHAFAAVMIPHHQAAVDMARVTMKFTTDQIVSAYCKHIISAEQVEIEQMLLFLNK